VTGSPGPTSTRYWVWAAVGIGAALLLIAIAVAVGRLASTGADATPSTVTGPSTASSPALTRPATPAGIGPGVYIVGIDIQPGTYRTNGAVPQQYTGGYCMWSRYDNVGGGPTDGILASDGSREGQMVVTIQPGDKRFLTRGCHPWTRVPQ
jgi:hypothetical protein